MGTTELSRPPWPPEARQASLDPLVGVSCRFSLPAGSGEQDQEAATRVSDLLIASQGAACAALPKLHALYCQGQPAQLPALHILQHPQVGRHGKAFC